jgi:hypothetical protein
MKYKFPKRIATAIVLGVLMICSIAYAGNIDPANDGSKYAWGENVGWINFEPSIGGGVFVTSAGLNGYAWSENIGWINLNPSTGGVVNDGAGNLSGYAWAENAGWINFEPTGGGVTISPDTGVFSGYAWGENIGWINFAPSGKLVKTSWKVVVNQYLGDMNNDGSIDISDVILVLRCALDLPIEPYECLPCGNIDQISGVDISDVILTLRMALGLDEWRPCKN